MRVYLQLRSYLLGLHSLRHASWPITIGRCLIPLSRTSTASLCVAAIALLCLATRSGIAQEQACTFYVGPNGAANNSGTTPTSPITLLQSAALATAGDVVCIEPGTYSLSRTFYPSHSGNPNAWIVFTNYGSGVVNILWTAGSNASDKNMFHLYNAIFPDGPSY